LRPIRNSILLLGLVVCASRITWGQQAQLDSNLSLFTVLAALNVAGYDADLDSPNNDPLRMEVRNALAAKNLPCLGDLKKFVAAHRRDDAGAELGQYISFALVTDGPPNFAFRAIANEVPPDAMALGGFAPLLRRFVREADIETMYKRAQPAFERTIARYHEPVTRAVLEVSAYLRNPPSGYGGTKFLVYVDLLGAPNQIHTRSYGGEYYVVVTPSAEPQVFDVRHTYLHSLIDPMSIKHAEEIRKKRSLIDFAMGAPALDESYKSDFLLLAAECLIKAVESRLAPGPETARQAIVDQALREGYILTPFFAEHLSFYEKQEQAMRWYLPELVGMIDLKKETQRLDKAQFVRQKPVRKAKVAHAPAKTEPTGAEKTLQSAEEFSDKRDLENARITFRKALTETEDSQLQARGYFGLARIAALQKDPELADKLFRKALELGPDPRVTSWAHFYLARLAELAGETAEAKQHYQVAAKVPGGSLKVREASEKALAGMGNQEKK
jgi:tetratricopeptide (TPR) repeat protein